MSAEILATVSRVVPAGIDSRDDLRDEKLPVTDVSRRFRQV
jgi:hypothetical protein